MFHTSMIVCITGVELFLVSGDLNTNSFQKKAYTTLLLPHDYDALISQIILSEFEIIIQW
jgi:hypothetical protein